MTVPDDVLVVDCLGRPCPIPVIELARAVTTVAPGTLVEVLSDDPAARVDVRAWCRLSGQEYVGDRALAAGAAYRVRRLR